MKYSETDLQEIYDELAGKFEYDAGMKREDVEVKAHLEMGRLGYTEENND